MVGSNQTIGFFVLAGVEIQLHAVAALLAA